MYVYILRVAVLPGKGVQVAMGKALVALLAKFFDLPVDRVVVEHRTDRHEGNRDEKKADAPL